MSVVYSIPATLTLPPKSETALRTVQGALTPFVFTVQDVDGAAVDFSSKTLAFVAYTDDGVSQVGQWKHDNGTVGGLGLSGSGNNVITVTPSSGDVAASQVLRWGLWDMTDNQLIGRGILEIQVARVTVP